jgi:hypothetical protein
MCIVLNKLQEKWLYEKMQKYFFINQKSSSWATLFLTMAYQWI